MLVLEKDSQALGALRKEMEDIRLRSSKHMSPRALLRESICLAAEHITRLVLTSHMS